MMPRPGVSALILAAGEGARMGGRAKALLPLGGSSLLGMAVQNLYRAGVEDVRVLTGKYAHSVAAESLRLSAGVVHNHSFERGMYSSVQAGLESLAANDPGLCRAVLILPVDAALVREQTIAALIAAWRSLPDGIRARAVLLPCFEGRFGHPPLVGAVHIPPLLAREGAGGLRGYFAGLLRSDEAEAFAGGHMPRAVADSFARRGQVDKDGSLRSCLPDTPFFMLRAKTVSPDLPVYYVPIPDAGITCDIDTPEDYADAQALLAQTQNRRRPLPEEARAWLLYANLGLRKIRHSIQVARGALRLGLALQGKGLAIDLELHLCAGLLHDVARSYREHARAAHAWVRAYGWRECALAVGSHTVLPDSLLKALGIPLRDLPLNSKGVLLTDFFIPEGYEAPLPGLLYACVCVYLADKFFAGDRLVSIPERFAAVREHFPGDGKVQEAICRREEVALSVRAVIEQKAGLAPEIILRTGSGHELENFLAGLEARCDAVLTQ